MARNRLIDRSADDTSDADPEYAGQGCVEGRRMGSSLEGDSMAKTTGTEYMNPARQVIDMYYNFVLI